MDWNINWNSSSVSIHFAFFSPYSKAINKAYEEYVLSVGNLDERIFLGEDAEEETGILSRCLNSGSGAETAERVQMKNILQQHFDKVSSARRVEVQEQNAGGSVLCWRLCVCVSVATSVKKIIPVITCHNWKCYLDFYLLI